MSLQHARRRLHGLLPDDEHRGGGNPRGVDGGGDDKGQGEAVGAHALLGAVRDVGLVDPAWDQLREQDHRPELAHPVAVATRHDTARHDMTPGSDEKRCVRAMQGDAG